MKGYLFVFLDGQQECARPNINILLTCRVFVMLGRGIDIDSHKPTCRINLIRLIRQSGQTPYPATKARLTHIAYSPPILVYILTVMGCEYDRNLVQTRETHWSKEAVDNPRLGGGIQGTEHIIQNKDLLFQSHSPRDCLDRRQKALESSTKANITSPPDALTSRWRWPPLSRVPPLPTFPDL